MNSPMTVLIRKPKLEDEHAFIAAMQLIMSVGQLPLKIG